MSDVLLQAFGLTVFLAPVWMGGLGWNWMRSRAAGTAILRWMGVGLAVIFTPALFGSAAVALAVDARDPG